MAPSLSPRPRAKSGETILHTIYDGKRKKKFEEYKSRSKNAALHDQKHRHAVISWLVKKKNFEKKKKTKTNPNPNHRSYIVRSSYMLIQQRGKHADAYFGPKEPGGINVAS